MYCLFKQVQTKLQQKHLCLWLQLMKLYSHGSFIIAHGNVNKRSLIVRFYGLSMQSLTQTFLSDYKFVLQPATLATFLLVGLVFRVLHGVINRGRSHAGIIKRTHEPYLAMCRCTLHLSCCVRMLLATRCKWRWEEEKELQTKFCIFKWGFWECFMCLCRHTELYTFSVWMRHFTGVNFQQVWTKKKDSTYDYDL